MNTNVDIASINYLPGCYCSDGRGRRRVDGKGSKDVWEIAPAPRQPVYVIIGGQRREARRWLWLWQIVRWCQQHLTTRPVRRWLRLPDDHYEHKIGRVPRREGEG